MPVFVVGLGVQYVCTLKFFVLVLRVCSGIVIISDKPPTV